MTTETESNEPIPVPDRWTLIRDVLVLQVKLVVDGLRDVVLVPVSLLVGLVSLLKSGPAAGTEFYELLRVGRRSERWIDLFGAAERVYGPALAEDRFPAESIDEIVGRMESFVVAEYQRGGVTKQAKDRLDRALDSLQKITTGEKPETTEKE